MRMWTRPSDRAPSYAACGQALEKLALPHRLPTLGALAPTSSPLVQQRFMGKATPPAPAGSRIAPSSQAIRLRNTPTNTRGDPTRQSAKQHLICSPCDRGQQYCGTHCSGLARGESLRTAGRRYQQSRRGRHCHAERQRRYRHRRREGACREKVTHQGSESLRCGAPLDVHRVPRHEASPSMSPQPDTTMHCHFCARPVSEFVRLRWRRSPVRRRSRIRTWH